MLLELKKSILNLGKLLVQDIIIREAKKGDFKKMWPIFKAVTEKGDSFIYDETVSKKEARNILMKDTYPFVAYKENDKKNIIGFYLIRQNRIGRGSHICNAAYMVDPNQQNLGLGKLMCKHSLEVAKNLGFHAMQFNIVVSTNKRAVSLWQKMGFEIIGTAPKAFKHISLGLVDAYIMYRIL